MEEFVIAKRVHIKVCDQGRRFKVKDDNQKDLLIGMFYQSIECGCCPPADSEERFKIFDTKECHLWSLQANPPEDCCGCQSNLESKIVKVGGGIMGELHGNPGSYIIKNASGDRLYALSSGLLTSSYEIVPTCDPNSKGKISIEFTFTNLMSKLVFPDCSSKTTDHKILILVTALEITHQYYQRQRRS